VLSVTAFASMPPMASSGRVKSLLLLGELNSSRMISSLFFTHTRQNFLYALTPMYVTEGSPPVRRLPTAIVHPPSGGALGWPLTPGPAKASISYGLWFGRASRCAPFTVPQHKRSFRIVKASASPNFSLLF